MPVFVVHAGFFLICSVYKGIFWIFWSFCYMLQRVAQTFDFFLIDVYHIIFQSNTIWLHIFLKKILFTIINDVLVSPPAQKEKMGKSFINFLLHLQPIYNEGFSNRKYFCLYKKFQQAFNVLFWDFRFAIQKKISNSFFRKSSSKVPIVGNPEPITSNPNLVLVFDLKIGSSLWCWPLRWEQLSRHRLYDNL